MDDPVMPAIGSNLSNECDETPLLRVARTGPRTFRMAGELDLSSVGIAERVLDPELPDGSRGEDLTLDLSDLSFMDSTGLHLLLRVVQSLGGALVLLHPQPHVLRVLELSRVAAIANVVVRTAPPAPPPPPAIVQQHASLSLVRRPDLAGG